ncbi:Muskelin 1, intracellular mediator containing kelch motif [Podila epigama]|nr:Muskelin 1, intracellular mediator containing kelch motif [Podila epigama]
MMLHPGSQPQQAPGYGIQDTGTSQSHRHGNVAKQNQSSSPSSTSTATSNKKQGDYLTALAIMRPRVLDYDVHSCSSYSASYLPENIKVNNPQDQSSRWSSGSNNQMQYIMIKLKTMAIAHTITFGKYHKLHVCNLKEFKVFGGLTSSNMTELLHTGLRNDNEPETFLLKHKTNSIVFPCQYIKIVPLMAWGANFNFSVWHVEVKGIPDPELVQETYFQYINFRETESVRLCLKHFRQRKLFDAFKALQERTQIQLEDPLLTSLHRELVVRGNFKRAEELMAKAAERGLFDQYIQSYDYRPIWKRLRSNSHKNGAHHHHHSLHSGAIEESPRQRGGHQMCIDTKGGYVYLMGGWDGARDLADFWAYHIPSQKWILISADTSQQGGPGARSCHKICYSPQHKAIFLLGKYVDPVNRGMVDLTSDFWRFDIDPQSPPHGRWTKISDNTAAMNGPELIYDHQMCLDPVSQTLYVFGGRVVRLDNDVQHYSGLYSYHIPTNAWKLLRADGHPPPKQDGTTVLRSRIGHSMLYDELMRGLVIFAGQMNKDYLSDFYVYDIAADRVIEVCKDYNKQGGPEAGFTQRATVSSRGREIYVLSGLVKDRALGAETVKNSFWVFKLPGQDQMDAIRDVQHALANAKSTGSIGSLKSIMNHGRPLSEQHDHGEEGDHSSLPSSVRPHTSRRKIQDDNASGPSEMRPRRGSTRTGGEDENSNRMSTRSSSQSRRASLRSGASTTMSETSEAEMSQARVNGVVPFALTNASDTYNMHHLNSAQTHSHQHQHYNNLNQHQLQHQHQHQHSHHHDSSASNMSSSSSVRREYQAANSIGSTVGENAGRMNDATATTRPMEPMSLAYVLSDQGSWQKIFQNSNPELGEPSEPEPAPRYAHQLVYDDVNEVQYLFGGNPGEQGNQSKRLDDFWELRLYRPKPEQIVRKAKYLLRTQQFKELCQRPETSALTSTTVLPTAPTSTNIGQQQQHSQIPVSEKSMMHHQQHHGNHRSNNGVQSERPRSSLEGCCESHSGLIQRGTAAHHDQSMRALKFLQTELSVVVDQTNKVESEDFKALIRGLLMGAFSPTTGIASAGALLGRSTASTSTSNTANTTRSGSGTRTTATGYSSGMMAGVGPQPQKTSVLLAPSPITSPAMSNTRLMMSPSLTSSSSSSQGSGGRPLGVRSFLASPNGDQLSIPVFGNRHVGGEGRGANGEEEREAEEEDETLDNEGDVDVNNDDPFALGANLQDNGAGGRREDEDALMMDTSMVSRRSVRGRVNAHTNATGLGVGIRVTAVGASTGTASTTGAATGTRDGELEGLDDNGDLVVRPRAIIATETDESAAVANGDDEVMMESTFFDRVNNNNNNNGGDGVKEGEGLQEEEDEQDIYDDFANAYSNPEDAQMMKAFYRDRTILYEKLLEFFAEDVKQPKGDLADLVKVG